MEINLFCQSFHCFINLEIRLEYMMMTTRNEGNNFIFFWLVEQVNT